MCADSTSCFPSWQVKSHKLKWLKDCLLYRGITNDGEIVVTPVVIATDMNQTKLHDGLHNWVAVQRWYL
jgi:hypothetical protein